MLVCRGHRSIAHLNSDSRQRIGYNCRGIYISASSSEYLVKTGAGVKDMKWGRTFWRWASCFYIDAFYSKIPSIQRYLIFTFWRWVAPPVGRLQEVYDSSTRHPYLVSYQYSVAFNDAHYS